MSSPPPTAVRMPRYVAAAILVCVLGGGVLRFWGLAHRGFWEVDEATYVLGARAYVSLYEARAEARRQGVDPRDREGMRRIFADVAPMDYDFRYHFTRGAARPDVRMSGFRTWGKPTFCAAVTLATWVRGHDDTLAALSVSALAGTCLIAVMGWAAWRLTGGAWATIGAAAWAATSLTLMQYSRTVYGAMLWTLCFAGLVGMGMSAWRHESISDRTWTTGARGVLTGVMLTVFYGMAPMVALIACVEMWTFWRLRRKGEVIARHATVWLVGCIVPVVAWQAAGIWREAYLHGTLGFENVFTYFGEVVDQLANEVELPQRPIADTVRYWARNTLALEGVAACICAAGGLLVLGARARKLEPAAMALLWLGGCWLLACTLSRQHFGRIYTPLLPFFGLCVGLGIQWVADRARAAAVILVAALVGYGLWNVRPLLAVRSGLPAAADWIAQHGAAGRIAVSTFGYNQLFRAHLHREVANPPTRAVLADQADLFVDVGGTSSRFTALTIDARPVATFPHPVLHYAPGQLDLGIVLDPFWRFRLTEADWQKLRGTDSAPAAIDLIRVYAVRDLL